METYNNSMVQPVPTFSAEANYFSLEKAMHKIKMDDPCMPEKIIVAVEDITAIVKIRRLSRLLKNLSAPAQIVNFADDDKVVNELAQDGDTLYISITNTGRIY